MNLSTALISKGFMDLRLRGDDKEKAEMTRIVAPET